MTDRKRHMPYWLRVLLPFLGSLSCCVGMVFTADSIWCLVLMFGALLFIGLGPASYSDHCEFNL